MKDLISRQAAIDAIDKNRQALLSLGMDGAEHILVHYGRRVIEELPKDGCEYWDDESSFCALHRPADLKRGKWKPFDLTWGRSVWACDACGETVDVPTLNGKPIFDYCPWCGAKMDGMEQKGEIK